MAHTVPGYESAVMTGLLAPAKTPEPLVRRINQAVVRYLTDVRDVFIQAGVEPVGSTPQEYAARMKNEIARMGKLFKEAGIKAE